MVTWAVPLGAMALCLAAEMLHLRRCRRMAYLAFGEAAAPRAWVVAVPWVRIVATGVLAWGLIVLLQIDAAVWRPEDETGEKVTVLHHVVIALDVSPSMQLRDAGPGRDQTRADRARDVLRSILERTDSSRTRLSFVAFYTASRPVVVDTSDRGVIANILDDLPLEHAFEAGKTKMYEGVKAAAEIGNAWAPGSASLLLVSDGDTLGAETLPTLPAAFGGSFVIGVGDPYRGTFIDGHSSRQDTESLNRLALRIGSSFFDANGRHVPTAELRKLQSSLPAANRGVLELRELAILAVVCGPGALAMIGPALALAGNGWQPEGKASRPVPLVREAQQEG